MAWDTEYALDGFFLFGAPLDVARYVIDPDDNRFGQSTDTYWVAHFLLDEESAVIARLDALIRGPMVYYQNVYLLRRSSASIGPAWVAEQHFFRPWLFSLEGEFRNPRSPALSTVGQTLGIAFDKADNPHIRARY